MPASRPPPAEPAPDRAVPLHFERAPAGLNRREALQWMAASLALAQGACSRPPEQAILPYVDAPEAGVAGAPLYYASAVLREGHAQGVLIGTRQGRPIKVEGNPAHPASLGAADVFAQAAVLQLWDPDRSGVVMQRLGASPAQAASTWPAFEAAWREQSARLDARAGEGLHLLTGPITSPTWHAQLAALRRRWPRAQWHRHAALDDTAARAGARLAFGRALHTVWHFDRAACVFALGADPFSDGPGAVRHAGDWARQRAASAQRGPRLFAAELAPGLFGTRAEQRIALPPAALDALLWRVAARLFDELAAPGAAAAPADGSAEAAFERQVSQALRAAGPDGLVIAGPSLAPESHALAQWLNQRLDAHGRGLTLIDAPDGPAASGDAKTLAALAADAAGGRVDTLLILGSNPVYDAPGALDLASALARVGFSAHLGLHRDETARCCHWHLPESHLFEQWSDARAHEGSATLIQPAIAPLYDTRSAHELLALLLADGPRDGYALVRRHWAAAAGNGDVDAFWRESLRRGVVQGSAAAPLSLPPARPPTRPAAAAPMALAAVFVPHPTLGDGQLANLGWLQELPQPFTKLTWDHALQLGPATAASLGVTTGDIVRADVDGRHLEAPVWVLAGHAEHVATLPLGGGRQHAGRVGNGVGFNAFSLRPVPGGPAALRLVPTGRRHDFAVTQHVMDPSGREPARTLRPGEHIAPEGDRPTLYPAWPSPEHAWAMVIDLDACIGCNACTIACQAENNIPVVGKKEVARGREMHWIRVDRYETPGSTRSIFQPVPCMHCENAPCEVVCPVGATVHDSEGLNVQVYNRCIGTRFCSNNCPYKVRRFNFLQYADTETETLALMRNPEVTVRQRGVMEKCNYCLQRIARARHHVETSGHALADGDVLTACQATCPTRAIHFGDLNDAASAVRRERESPRHYALLGELNTRPRTTYLARVAPPEDD